MCPSRGTAACKKESVYYLSDEDQCPAACPDHVLGRHCFAGDGQCYFYLIPPPRESAYCDEMIHSEGRLVVDGRKQTRVDNCSIRISLHACW